MNDSKLGTGLTVVLAIACGICVANIYYNQPLLGLLEQAYADDLSVVNLVPTVTQLGYAAGLLLLVPLGDRIERRRLILLQIFASAVALMLLAEAPRAWSVVAASMLVGITSSVAQQIVPLAADLAAPSKRGQVVGTVMSGVLCGILIGRALGGFIAEHYGWRATFWMGAVLTGSIGVVLAWVLPSSPPKSQHGYRDLMRSLATIFWQEPALRRATAIQAALFASFIGLWTVLALQLQSHYALGASIAGLFGLVGAVGILVAPLAGRIADRRGPHTLIGAGCVVMLVSWVVFGAWGSIAGLVVGVILLDFGEQAALISNQHVIYALRPEARSRINTIFIGGMFLGGATGSWGAAFSWLKGGWFGVCAFGSVLVVIGLLLYVTGRAGAPRAAS